MSVQYCDKRVVQYLADTQDGSSGSPVFNVEMHPIAVHHAEVAVEIDLEGRTDIAWRNEGISISQIMLDLDAAGIKYETNLSP